MLRAVCMLALTIPLAACDDPPTPAPPPPVEPAPTPAPEETPPLEEPDTIVAPSYSEAELDAMDPAALEAACFQGSTAACDRLGH